MEIRRKIGLLLLIVGLICIITGLLYGVIFNWSSSMYGWVLAIDAGIIPMIIGLVCLGLSTRSKIKEEVIENSRIIVDFLKKDNSGITQHRLALVLQIEPTIIKKSLDHLKWLGVVEEKKATAEKTLFFYKKDHKEDNRKISE